MLTVMDAMPGLPRRIAAPEPKHPCRIQASLIRAACGQSLRHLEGKVPGAHAGIKCLPGYT